jgi:predicted Fe-Mo cluster-binding NifX family protein
MWNRMVKTAIPVVTKNGLKSELNEHFGMAEDFVVFEYERGEVADLQFITNDTLKTKEPKQNAAFLVDAGVKIVLSGSIGPHMLVILLKEGVRVFKGGAGTAEDVIEDYKAGMLTEVHTPGEMMD